MTVQIKCDDRVVEIERLAALDPLDYETARVSASENLGVRTSVLDREVARKRRVLGLVKRDDGGQGRAVRIDVVLPWHEPVDGNVLADTLAAAIKTYAVLPDACADTVALWVLATWLVNQFSIAPRLAMTSPAKGCGKTTVLRLLNVVTRRPKRAGSISPPALFRAVEEFQPTILLDETEKYIEHGSDLHALLNEGHAKGGTVLRVLGDKLELREFSVYGAVAFARNGRLPDDLEQRSIVIEMQRRRPDEDIAELRDDRCEPLHRIARQCARWAEDNAADVREIDPEMVGLINRVADNWRPLFAIADAIGSDWPARAREAAAALAPREADSIGPTLLGDIRKVFDEKATDRLSSAELVEALHAIEGRPWAEWGKAGRTKPISPNQLAQLLKPFAIVSTVVRIGQKTSRAYHLWQFEDAFDRYLAPQGVYETKHRNKCDEIRTSGTFQNVTSKPDVTIQKCEEPNNDGLCYDVTKEGGDRGNGVNGSQPAPRCVQCGKPSTAPNPLLEVCVNGRELRLHRGCIDDWRALDIPPYLDRRSHATKGYPQ